ncbi:MAG TPA: PKD domain-containing protein, partial [Gammaproteobacteria bacterium]
WVPASQLTAAAELPGVSRVSLPRYAITKRTPAHGAQTRTGSVVTQGDRILGANTFRANTGITGKGVSVGVISDGDQHITDSQKTGDLPQTVWDDPKDAGGKGGFSPASSGDEGTAMMEIVYDLAPGVSQLGFCGPQTSVDFITCLDDFNANISPNIIVDDLGFPGGAMFSDDTFTTAVTSFATSNPNIHLVTAAGNDGSGFWQGTWVSSGALPVNTTVNGVHYTQALDFGGGDPFLELDVVPNDMISYIVEWDDPWTDVTTAPNDPNDFDVVVFDDNTGSGTAVACNQGINIGPATNGTKCNQANTKSLKSPGPQPIQGSVWNANQGTYYLEIFAGTGSNANLIGKRLKILVFDESSQQVLVFPFTSGSVYGHAALGEPIETTAGAVYSGDLSLESYSSTGPVELGTGPTATSVAKPDFVAPDCVNVTGAGGFQTPFCGTSAAAPHIAGLMALLISGYPNQSPYNLLKESAVPGAPNGQTGHGLPDMQKLLDDGIFPSPTVTISTPAKSASIPVDQATTFSGSCTAHGPGTLTYVWSFGDSGVADKKGSDVSVTFKKNGTFSVVLTCTAGEAVGTSSINVRVQAPPSSGGGGGAFYLLSLLTLAGINWLRRRS